MVESIASESARVSRLRLERDLLGKLDLRPAEAPGDRERAGVFGVAAATLLACLLLSGCGSFFAKTTTTTTTTSPTTPTTTTGDYLYVANSNTSLDTVAGYSLASGALSAVSGSPYQLGVLPYSVAITPSNSLLYVGSELGGVYVYTIGSDGALTINSSGVVASISATSMAVDSTGQWLIAMQDGGTAPIITVFAINTTTGALTTQSTVTLDTGSSGSLLFVPNSTLVYATLGTGGVDALSFDAGSGVLTKLSVLLSPRGSAYADQRLATNSTGTLLFVTETGTNGIRGFTINSTGTLSELAGSPTPAGLGIGAIVVDATSSFLYAANSADSTISAFTLSGAGALTAIAGSPFATGSTPHDMVEDNSKGYLAVACPGGTPDLELFTITPGTGVLAKAITQSTGSVSPAGAFAIVASH